MSVFEKVRGSGEWWVRYADQYGHIHREKVGPKSLAQKAYEKRKTDIREGKFFPEKLSQRRDMLFKDMAKLYLEEHSKVNKRSYEGDRHLMARLNEAFGEKALSEITTEDVERFKNRLKQQGTVKKPKRGAKPRPLSEATVNRHLALLSGVFNKATAWKKTKAGNPVKEVKKFKENNERVRFLTEEEEARLRTVFPEEHWPLVEVALHTGMRRGEQFNLRWRDVNFHTRTITIPRSKSGELRHVRMNDRVMEILRGLPGRLKGEWVFPSETGESPLDANNFINRVSNPALKGAKITDFRWHDLRHTFASRLTMAGVDLRTLQELMGHKTIKMTLRYSHLSPTHTLEAVNKLCLTSQASGTRTGTEENQQLAGGV
ncbi:MAG: site-specific integrase [Chloroflexi bacterium]|nr:site-specific integrase [Chloroflexota bacterium]